MAVAPGIRSQDTINAMVIHVNMNTFDSTSKRLRNLKRRIPGFPLEKMRLLRMTYHVQKNMRDLANSVLKEHDLVDATYLVLAVLYGCEKETASASELGQACHEKPANMTRLCNELELRGLIRRDSHPADRRAVMIALTPSGRQTIEPVLPKMWHTTLQAYDGFDSEELQQLDDMLSRQLNNLANISEV